jgi:hypothetical protein
MASQRNVRNEQVQAILKEWRQTSRNLYATVFDTDGMQTCAGQVMFLEDEIAMISDSHVDLRIPYASADDCAIATLDQRTKSVTLTWRDGTSAFIVTHNGSPFRNH